MRSFSFDKKMPHVTTHIWAEIFLEHRRQQHAVASVYVKYSRSQNLHFICISGYVLFSFSPSTFFSYYYCCCRFWSLYGSTRWTYIIHVGVYVKCWFTHITQILIYVGIRILWNSNGGRSTPTATSVVLNEMRSLSKYFYSPLYI